MLSSTNTDVSEVQTAADAKFLLSSKKSGHQINGSGGSEPKPLQILIAGAGIGGLSAAIALRRAGHNVQIFESSRFASETGAAIHLPPNVNGLLRRFGMLPEDIGANLTEWVSEYKPNGENVFTRDMSGLRRQFVHPWQLCHRVDLHNGLKDLATGKGLGKPAVIHLQSKVLSVDTDAPSITLANGDVIHGDLVIGADGVHSRLRSFVTGSEVPVEPSGASAYRFLVPVSKVLENPVTRRFVERKGELGLWYGNERRIVVYPCRNNTELNFVAIHPDEESEGSTEDWDVAGSKDRMLKIFSMYCPDVMALLEMAEPSTIKLWKLLDRPALDTWIKGKCALLGDAAHPFLPHQGQGGAQAIEDAAALGALLPLGTTIDDIEDRLKLYEKCRYERATMVQDVTRQAAFSTKKLAANAKVIDPMQFTEINFDHDAYDFAQGALLRHLASKARFQRMPLGYGPSPGPRQDMNGKARKFSASYQTAHITFRTPKSYLNSLMPTDDFRIAARGGWSTATFSVTKLGKLNWLGGRGYTHFGLYVHDTAAQVDGKAAKGDLISVLFEDLADPIITGREELGFPKVYATLETQLSESSYSLKAGWQGTNFCSFSLSDLEKIPAEPLSKAPDLTYKVVPSKTGTVDAAYAEIMVDPLVRPDTDSQWKAGGASITFTDLEDGELERSFPTLAHIITRLRGIMIGEVLSSGVRMSEDFTGVQALS